MEFTPSVGSVWKVKDCPFWFIITNVGTWTTIQGLYDNHLTRVFSGKEEIKKTSPTLVRAVPCSRDLLLRRNGDTIARIDEIRLALVTHPWLIGPLHVELLTQNLGSINPDSMWFLSTEPAILSVTTNSSRVNVFRSRLYQAVNAVQITSLEMHRRVCHETA